MASLIRKPTARYFTTPAQVRAALPHAQLGFADQLGYYARTPGAKPPVTPRSIAVAKANAAAKAVAAAKTAAAPTSMQAIINDYWAHRQTPAQQKAASTAEVNSAINQGVRGINSATAAETAKLNAAAARAQNYALAVAKLQADDPKQIQDAYLRSASTLGSLGQGLTGSALEAQQAAAKEAVDAVSRATSGGVTDLTGVVNPSDARSALLYSNVTIPGSTMAEEGAAAFADAKARNVATKFGVEQVAQDYLHKASDLTIESARKIADLRATRPDLFQKAIDSYRSAGRQDIATILQAMALANTQANTQSLIGTRKATTAQGAKKVAQGATKVQQAWSGLTGIDERTGLVLPKYYFKNKSDEQRKIATKIPAGMMVAPNNPYKLIPTKKGSATAGTTNTKNVQQILTRVQTQVKDVVGRPPYASYNKILDDAGVGQPYKPLMDYDTALQQLLQYVPPAYRKDKRMLQVLHDQLRRVGYPEPSPTVNPPPGVKGPVGTQ